MKQVASFSAKLQNVVDTYAAKYFLPGSVVGLWRPGEEDVVITQGFSDIATKKPMTADDTFIIASVTKSFVGIVAFQLIAEGKLSLDSKLSEFQPNFPNGENITVEQLLHMTSGIYDYSADPVVNKCLGYHPNQLPDLVWSTEDLISIASTNKPYFAPGEGLHYSNSNTVILGVIIEKVTGSTLKEQIARRITVPLGLKNTYLPASAEENRPTAVGYYVDNDTGESYVAPNVNPSFLWAAGAMISNLSDLKVWAKALGTGQLITPALRQEQRKQFYPLKLDGAPKFFDDMNPGYGLALERYQTEPNEFIGHSGKTTNFNAQMFYQPSTGSVLITLTNTATVAGFGPLFFATVAQAAIPGSFPNVIAPSA